MTDNTNLGDVAIETSFADYQDVNGLKLPARLTTKTDRYHDRRDSRDATDRRRRHRRSRGAAAAASPPPVTGPPPATVTAEESRQGHLVPRRPVAHSVLVEFSDHLMLIEAPQNDTRALAVIAKARELRPGKPITQVVNTHHHFDHSGGMRAAVAKGSPS